MKARGRPSYKAIYATTSSDLDAARRFHVSQRKFKAWRDRHGLPNKYHPAGRPPRPDVEDVRMRAYESTETDAAAAAISGTSREAFGKWREMRGLAARLKTPRPHASEDEVLRWFLAWEMTSNDREAGALLGMKATEFCRRRRRWLGLPAHNIPTVGHRGNLIRGHEEERRMAVYRLGLTDAESAKLLGIHRASFQGWRGYRHLPAPRTTSCAACGARCLPRSPLRFCATCRRELAARRESRWLNDGAFREYVRSLDGQRVTMRYCTGERDPPFAGVRGILEVNPVGQAYVLVGAAKVQKRRICRIRPDYRDVDWPCGDGCGGTVRFGEDWQPSHPPPFFIPGHSSRTPKAREAAGKQLAKYRGWNRGLHGEEFWSHYSPAARARMIANLDAERERNAAKATHTVRDEKGHVYVRVPGFYPSGAARIKARARLVMEERLGRGLRPDEIVWHVNGANGDDRPENLVVLPAAEKGSLAHGLRRGLRGRELLAWVRDMHEEREAFTPKERRRARRQDTPAQAPFRPAGSSPFCPDCGMLAFPGSPHRCRAPNDLPPNWVASAPPAFSSDPADDLREA